MKKLKILLVNSLLLFVLIAQAQTTANWQSIGPKTFPVTDGTPGVSYAIGMGRVSQIAFHPTNADIMYAISASAGVFKTIDGGVNWQVLNTDYLTRGVSAICIDNSDPNTIYIGLGDVDYVSSGGGVWKSIDGGQTWFSSSTGMGDELILRIVKDPLQPSRIIAAGKTGLYLSTDAGQNWTKTFTGYFQDLVLNTNNNSGIAYAINQGGEFYRTTDIGTSWVKIPSVILAGGLGSGNSGSRIAVTNANANIVYVAFLANKGTVMKSTDGGITFSYVKNATSPNLPAYDNTPTSSTQGNFNFDIAVDPENSNKIWLVGHCVWRSDDGGINWSKLTIWSGVMHTDLHHIVVNPLRTTDLLCANDGGIYVSNDGGTAWTPKCNGLVATEFYHAANSPVNGNFIIGGLQDNGRQYTLNKNTFLADLAADRNHYIEVDYNNYTYHFQGTVNRKDYITGKAAGTLNWPFTVAQNGSEFHQVAFNKLNTNLAFAARNTGLFRTTNLGTTATVSWSNIQPFSSEIRAIGIAPDKTNILYFVTSDSKFYRSITADQTTVSIDATLTTPIPVTGNIKARIAVMPNSNGQIVYLSCDTRVWRSANSGTSWTEISTGLPAVAISQIYADNYKTDESVYIMNAVGAYYKNTLLSSWQNFSQGLPDVANLKEYFIFNDGTSNARLRIATYGRGLWETPLVSLGNPAPVVSITSPINNATFTAPASVTINATATISSGTISKVEFFNGTIKLGEDLTAPYSYSWTSVAAGTYALTAKATSNTNSATTSSIVNITVNTASVCNNSLEPNATLGAAIAITTSSTLKSQIASATDLDWFKFTPAISGNLTITLTTLPFDYDLHLFNASGTELVKSDNGGTTNESLPYNVSAGVTYYIKILGYQNVFSTTSCYTLTVSGVAPAMASNQPVSIVNLEKVNKDALNVTVSPNPSDGDFKLNINSKSTEGIQVRVMDMKGRLLKVIRSTTGLPIQFGRGMKAGTYLVEVKQGEKTKTIRVIKL